MQSGSTFQVSTASTAVFFGNVAGTNFFTGPGTKDFEGGSSALGPVGTITGSTIVESPATVTADYFTEAAVTVDGRLNITHKALNDDPSAVSTIGTLTIGGGGAMDLSNNQMSAGIPLATTRADLHSGALFTSATGGVLGYIDLGGGVTEVKFTLLGDTNLDGKVDVTDLGNLASNYGAASGAFWQQGDFDYNGAVDVTDLGDLASNYGATLAAGSAFAGDMLARPTDIASVDSVPEAASALAAFTAIGLWAARGRLNRRARRFPPDAG
jgi:hypothetical protein